MRKGLRIAWKSLVTLAVIGLFAFVFSLRVWEAVLMILAIFFLFNVAGLLTKNRTQALKNLKGFFQWLKEDANNIKTWIIGE